jgi:glutathione S-transferase
MPLLPAAGEYIVILYEHPFSPFAQKIKIALREKAIPFEAVTPPDLGSGNESELIHSFGPRREVPTLVDDDGTSMFDSTIILEYLEEKYPVPSLLPANPADRATARTIEDMCDTHFEAITWGLNEVRFFGRGKGGLNDTLYQQAVVQVGHFYAWLTAALGDKDWLVGDTFGRADLSVIPIVSAFIVHGIPPADDSAVAQWMARARLRPSVAKTEEESLAVVPLLEALGDAVGEGVFKRHYRDHRLEWMVRSGGLQVLLDGLGKGDIRFTETEQFLP